MTDGYVASSGLADTSGSGTPSITIPSAVQGGDLMVAACSSAQAGISFPVGWTVLGTIHPPSGGSGLTCTVAYKRAAGSLGVSSSEAGSAVTATPNTTGSKSSLAFAAWRGVDATAPILDFGTPIETDSASGSTSFAIPGVTTSVDGAFIITAITDKSSVATVFTAPSGYTIRADGTYGTGTGKADALLASKQAGSAGPYGGESWGTGVGPGQVVTWTLALAPVSTTTTLLPVADVTKTNVTGVTDNSTLFTNVARSVTNLARYVEFLVTGVYRATVTSLGADPGTDSGWVVDYALGLGSGASSTDWTLKVVQGTTVIETWTVTVTADPTELTRTLNPTNVANIDLSSLPANTLRLEASMTAAS
jgi:hypothetical protein